MRPARGPTSRSTLHARHSRRGSGVKSGRSPLIPGVKLANVHGNTVVVPGHRPVRRDYGPRADVGKPYVEGERRRLRAAGDQRAAGSVRGVDDLYFALVFGYTRNS